MTDKIEPRKEPDRPRPEPTEETRRKPVRPGRRKRTADPFEDQQGAESPYLRKA